MSLVRNLYDGHMMEPDEDIFGHGWPYTDWELYTFLDYFFELARQQAKTRREKLRVNRAIEGLIKVLWAEVCRGDYYESETEALRAKVKELEKELECPQEYRDEGIIIRRPQFTLHRLVDFGLGDCIGIKQFIDKKALRRLDDKTLKRLGVFKTRATENPEKSPQSERDPK